MAAGGQERTEEATPRRLREARQRGEVARSADLSSAVQLVVAVVALGALLPAAGALLRETTRRTFELAVRPDLTPERALEALGAAVADGAGSLATLLLVLAVAAAATAFFQVGPLLTLEPLRPRLERLDPLAGLRRLFLEPSTWFELAKALLRTLVVAAVAWIVVRTHLNELLALARLEPLEAGRVVLGVLGRLATWTAVTVLALGAIDFFHQRWNHARRLRMSKQEVREEHREQEGDPHVRSWRRQAHQEVLEGALVEAVRGADVIVVNPDHLACALRYDPDEEGAPRLLGKGRGVLAERIKRIAREEGIPIVRDVGLARALHELEEGEEIPEALYDGVVAVLRWVEEVARAEGREVGWARPGSAGPAPGAED